MMRIRSAGFTLVTSPAVSSSSTTLPFGGVLRTLGRIIRSIAAPWANQLGCISFDGASPETLDDPDKCFTS